MTTKTVKEIADTWGMDADAVECLLEQGKLPGEKAEDSGEWSVKTTDAEKILGATRPADSQRSGIVAGMNPALVFLLLFAVMVIPSGLFIWDSFGELEKVQQKIYELPPSMAKAAIDETEGTSLKSNLDIVRTLVALETDASAWRTHRLQAFTATRTWLRFMSLLFGAILVIIGASFILGKITTPDSNVDLSVGDKFKTSMVTSSPGLILILFGVALIVFRSGFDEKITATEGATYINAVTVSTLLGNSPASSVKFTPTKEQEDAANAELEEILRDMEGK
ncbi:MAG: hypothetical protein MI741_10755 [Rhodospirillales bacterium]|nr:hypothetical protein [Rhodospirillales bacterium]